MSAPPVFMGRPSGARLDSLTALRLAALPGFSPGWAIVPGPNGRGLTLAQAERLTAADRARAGRWARKNAQRIRRAALGVSGRVVMCSPDPDTGRILLGLTSGELLDVPPGTYAAIILHPALPLPLLILRPGSAEARALELPPQLAQVLAQSFPLAQAIREGQGARHDA